VQTIQDRRPELIVECGSGTSTVLAASVLRELGTGKILSLDHDAKFAEQTRENLRQRGLEDWAEVVTAPLVMREVEGDQRRWYDVDLSAWTHGTIDMLVVDGPPRRSATLARYPAVPLLRDLMAPGCAIVLDDGNRPDERAIARKWEPLLGGTSRRARDGKGAWVFEVPSAADRGKSV
jgi:predicted O-methyltransferase YrrM